MDTLKKKMEYLIFVSTDKNKEVLTKYIELWDRIKNLIECSSIKKINDKPGEYRNDFINLIQMIIRFK